MSAIVSPWPSCMSAPDRTMDCPPICRTPTSKEMRVRVDGFSKISATMRPARGVSSSGMPFGRPARAAFIAPAWSSMARRASPGVRWMSRKWVMDVSRGRRPGGRAPGRPGCVDRGGGQAGSGTATRAGRAVQARQRLADVGILDVERGQQAQHVVAAGGWPASPRHRRRAARRRWARGTSGPASAPSRARTRTRRDGRRRAPRAPGGTGPPCGGRPTGRRRRPRCPSPRRPTAQASGLPP